MPAISAGSCDPIDAALRKSIEGPNSGRNVDEQLISSAKRVLLSKIEYHPAEKEYSAALKNLQSKYIHLNSSAERPEAVHGRKDDNHGTMTVNGSREDCRLDIDGIPIPRIVIHPLDNVKLGWLRVNKIGAGLANLGNTCFLNATLQCLTYTPPLVNHLIEFDEHSALCKNVGFCMMCELQRHIRQALKKNGEILRPQCILQKLKAIAAHMTWGRQEDAHEFLRYMMESMISFSLNGYTTSKLDRVSYETTVVSQIFGGYHRSQVICLRCKEKSDTYDHFMDVMLDIKNAPSLEKALEHFVQPEVLDSENAYMCPNCKQKCPAKKRFTIHRSPNIATFQLKRFDYTRSMGGKITKQISFPEKLDIRSYMSQRQGPPIMYALYAVLVHQGVSCNSGHYFCFVRNSNNLWYLMDDSKVRQVSLNYVLNQQAYLLFYTRISNSGQVLKSPIQLQSPGPRLPLVSVSAGSCSSSSASNNGGSSGSGLSNGMAAGNPVSNNESFGIPIARKTSLLGPGPAVMKPKPLISAAAATNNIMAGPNSLPAHRDKVAFDFKMANSHGGVASSHSSSAAGASATAKASTYPGKSGTSNGPCPVGGPDSTTQPKHPRIVMHIKNGKVYNCHPLWNPTPSAAAGSALTASLDGTKVRSSLVPYAPDSSEESDQDTTNGRRSGSPRGPLSNFSSIAVASAAAGSSNSASIANKSSFEGVAVKNELGSGHLKVKMDAQLNATTELPGLPKSRSSVLEDFVPRSVRDAVKSESDDGSAVRKEDSSVNANVGQLIVLTSGGGVSGAGAAKVINATTSQWLVTDGNQQSPSVASEGSNTSVNSTTGWQVLDADGSGTKVGTEHRQYSRWTVTPVPDDGEGGEDGQLEVGGVRKKSSSSSIGRNGGECGAKLKRCDRKESAGGERMSELGGVEQLSRGRTLVGESVVPHQGDTCADLSTAKNPILTTSAAVATTASVVRGDFATGDSHRTLGSSEAGGCDETKSLLAHTIAASPCSKSKSSLSVSAFGGSFSEYKWANGGLVGGSDSRHQKHQNHPHHPRQHIHFDSPDDDEEGREVVVAEDDNRLAPPTVTAEGVVLTNGHCGPHSDSPDDQQQPSLSSKRHRKKKKHKRDRGDPVEEDSKWKKKAGKRKETEVDGREDSGSPNAKRKRHSHGGSSSDGSFELEWVEKTKETLEQESKTTTKDNSCQNNADTTVTSGLPLQQPKSTEVETSLKNGDLHGSVLPASSDDCGSNVVAELLKKGGRGFGDGVNSWEGGQSMVNRDVERESKLEWNRRHLDGYNENYDRGKVKKPKPFQNYSSPNYASTNFQSNPFQRAQDVKPGGRFFPNRWQQSSGSQSPYSWEGHHRGNHNSHYNNRNRSDGRYYFSRKY